MFRAVVENYTKAMIRQQDHPEDESPFGDLSTDPLQIIRHQSQMRTALADLTYYLIPHHETLAPLIDNLNEAIKTYGRLRHGIPTNGLVEATAKVVSTIEDLIVLATHLDTQRHTDN